ncbi:uncharacterized protein DUF3822 [Balneicella halophila]|uniref:Uncharacterized protein DUF3822 n=1 Tax=Balneicella halophila TaxID=1537566 RepID=A0A7L4UMB6_BALHA|nr:DUF3822 family protein [Balneicella halophila]PVX49366.1 uncharacterized protein DUF3822 [Balneicella halophila]
MTANNNTTYSLSIQLALDGFSFLLYNRNKNSIELEKEVRYTEQEKFYDWLKVKLAKEEILRRKYESINLLYTPEKFTLVPTVFIEEKKLKELFSLTFPLEETEMIESEMVGNYTMLSAITSDYYNLVKDYFPKLKVKTTPTLLLEMLDTSTIWNIGVVILYQKLHIIVIKDDKVQLCNSFQFLTKDDLLFYMLYTFDNLDIPVTNSSIQLFGNRDYLPLLKNELTRYHNDIRIMEPACGLTSKIPMGNLLLSNS